MIDDGEIERGLAILKARGSRPDAHLRELLITAEASSSASRSPVGPPGLRIGRVLGPDERWKYIFLSLPVCTVAAAAIVAVMLLLLLYL